MGAQPQHLPARPYRRITRLIDGEAYTRPPLPPISDEFRRIHRDGDRRRPFATASADRPQIAYPSGGIVRRLNATIEWLNALSNSSKFLLALTLGSIAMMALGWRP